MFGQCGVDSPPRSALAVQLLRLVYGYIHGHIIDVSTFIDIHIYIYMAISMDAYVHMCVDTRRIF